MARIRRTLVHGAAVCAITAVLFVSGSEILLRAFYPQVTMFPRWEPSPAYGVVLPKNATMVHRRPGRWEFQYTINEDRCRGPRVPVTAVADDTVVVTLGDSYTMGMGVGDGEEFPAVLARELDDGYRVLNCGSPGWGLTQEVRRFYEFALQYSPRVVILQFCANDPEDGRRDAVTRVENNRFVFHSTSHGPNPIFNALSKYRLIQSSQLYALFRAWYESRRNAGRAHAAAVSKAEQDYIELLGAFARDLNARKIRLIMISVTGQLDEFPAIRVSVMALQDEKVLRYVEVADWFKGIDNFASPEGHRWGATAHAIVGKELARTVRESNAAADGR